LLLQDWGEAESPKKQKIRLNKEKSSGECRVRVVWGTKNYKVEHAKNDIGNLLQPKNATQHSRQRKGEKRTWGKPR